MTEQNLIDLFVDDLNACPSKQLIEKIKKGEIKNPWELVNAEKEEINKLKGETAQSKLLGDMHETVAVNEKEGKVFVGKGTLIDAFVVLEGPLVIGENCEVRSGAWVRPGTFVGNNCVIGHGVELKNTLMFNKAKIGTNCFVGDSVMAKGARAGSGTIIGNRRFDQAIVKVKIEGTLHSTETDKFGAVLGEFSRLGANVATSPGTLLGKHSWVYGGILLAGYTKPNSFIKLRQDVEVSEKETVELKDTDLKGKI